MAQITTFKDEMFTKLIIGSEPFENYDKIIQNIKSMGIEKVIPRLEDLSVFTRLLARSATGQPITSYTSHFHAPIEGGEMHIIIVDNNRSQFLASEKNKKALNCIRCGACMNTCQFIEEVVVTRMNMLFQDQLVQF